MCCNRGSLSTGHLAQNLNKLYASVQLICVFKHLAELGQSKTKRVLLTGLLASYTPELTIQGNTRAQFGYLACPQPASG